jgi:hypothetical protein
MKERHLKQKQLGEGKLGGLMIPILASLAISELHIILEGGNIPIILSGRDRQLQVDVPVLVMQDRGSHPSSRSKKLRMLGSHQ